MVRAYIMQEKAQNISLKRYFPFPFLLYDSPVVSIKALCKVFVVEIYVGNWDEDKKHIMQF